MLYILDLDTIVKRLILPSFDGFEKVMLSFKIVFKESTGSIPSMYLLYDIAT